MSKVNLVSEDLASVKGGFKFGIGLMCAYYVYKVILVVDKEAARVLSPKVTRLSEKLDDYLDEKYR